MKKNKLIILVVLIFGTLLVTGCPGKIDPGQNKNTNLGSISKIWGVPQIREITAGFNGIPTEGNNKGPAEGPAPSNP